MLNSIDHNLEESSSEYQDSSVSNKETIATKKRRILVIGDAVASTGFARVIRNILEPLVGQYDIHQIGISYHGDPHTYPWPLYPAIVGGDFYGVGRIQSLVEKIQPDLVFAVNDLWTLGKYMEILKHYRDVLKILLYCPIESGLIDFSRVISLSGAHQIVAYNQFGKQELETAIDWAKRSNPKLEFASEIAVIPHGVDSRKFTYLFHDAVNEKFSNSRLQAKKRLWPDFKDIEDSFIVLNANRNQPRKRIDLTLQGFAIFAKSKPDNVRLYLHMGLEDLGWNILRLAESLDIENRLILSTTSPTIPSISDEQMNLVYNACDVGLNTSTGEGWGLVNFEHAATQAPQIITAHEVAKELWSDQAELLEPLITLVEPQILTKAHIVSPVDIAASLDNLYQNPDKRQAMGIAAYKNATQASYSWQHISQAWMYQFEALLPCTRINPE